MGCDAWQRREEVVAANPDLADVGVGRDAVRVTGLSGEEISNAVVEVLHDLVDGGANAVVMHTTAGAVTLYVRRRGRSVDVGTRRDFADLGWASICDRLDVPAGG
jgi:hypothetical protein